MSLPAAQLLSVSSSTNRKRLSDSPRDSSKVAKVSESECEVSQRENTHPDHFNPSTEALTELDFLRHPSPSTGSPSSSCSESMSSEGQSDGLLGVVDLTADSDREEVTVVDLTSDCGIEQRDASCISEAVFANARTEQRHISEVVTDAPAQRRDTICISESDDDVIILPSTPTAKPSTRTTKPPALPSTPPPTKPPVSSAASSPDITCPICMDSKKSFARSGRTLVTTKCGHLFCDACLKQSITLLHKCPTCSGKLTVKQYHRIYI